MSKQNREPREERRRLSDLIDHPLQQKIFGNLSDHELRALAENIRKKRLREKIQILPKNKAGLPANTIIDGHQRRRALVLNGERDAVVVVRYDLSDSDEATIASEFFDPNVLRRQLDAMGKVRVAACLSEIARNGSRGPLSYEQREALRAHVAAVLGMSPKNAERYLNVSLTPMAIQNALSSGKLSLIGADAVSREKPDVQAQIAARIAAGECPKALIRRYVKPCGGCHPRPRAALTSAMKSLRRMQRDLGDRLGSIPNDALPRWLNDLENAKKLIAALTTKAKKGAKCRTSETAIERMARVLGN